MHLLPALLEIRFPWIDPVALDLPGPVDVRWYGLAYLLGFAAAYALLLRMSRDGFIPLDREGVGGLVTAGVLGVVLGGRLGYVLFYDFADFASSPLRILRVWEGGLSFHGGAAGVIVAAWWYARRERLGFLRLGDAAALVAPFGLFAGRVANFVNGELYGRVASPDVPWAMRFPTDPAALRRLGAEGGGMRSREEAIGAAYRSGAWERVREEVPLRHPSQLYEAVLEGVVLAAVLWGVYAWMRRRGRTLPPGTYGGIFLLGYGLARSFVELFRQPDAQFRSADDPVGTVLGPLTMGQALSAVMVVAGLLLVARALRPRAHPDYGVAEPLEPPLG
ncbi:MAG TPA: prolipoprotein diacylglyceryl transferase [Longimicrobiaceae bacterium]|nr:prolipoprotein diacylglyceryl transferase [Longimicrobiaceae bacterium]